MAGNPRQYGMTPGNHGVNHGVFIPETQYWEWASPCFGSGHVAREYVYTWVCLGNRGAFSRRQETGAGVRETDVTAPKYPAPRLE